MKKQAATFPAYKAKQRPVKVYPAYFDAEKKSFTPLSKAKRKATDLDTFHEVLDSITLAVEAGIVPVAGWVKFFFGTAKKFEAFLDEMHAYGEVNRPTDRWWNALETLADTGSDEAGFVTFEDISDRLREAAKDSGQL